jgi:flavin-dependent dehydrogenase
VISGEGIGPAVDSGALAAAQVLERLGGRAEEDVAADYRAALSARFGSSVPAFAERLARRLPVNWLHALGGFICRNDWLRRRVVFEGAFGMA